MQGKKEYKEKIFVSFRLSERVPQDNFYRRLKGCLDLSYLRKLAKKYYGTGGQKSIDTEAFFKLMLIGYLENINSDRKIIEQAQLRFRRLKKVYTKSNDLANKQVLMAAAAYNLKKLMGFNSMKTAVKSIENIILDVKISILGQILLFFELICWFWKQSVQIKKINDWVWLVKV